MKAYAYVNHSRWIVECPSDTCRDAVVAPPGTDRYRCRCRDSIVCQHGVPCDTLIEPAYPSDTAAIADVLRLRRDPANRNWEPGETVERLVADNLEHGLAVP